ncbi:MAG: HupE/UreJ family protein [Gammaproteobacteria bacterium]|nr:HupE/UreJ family protein [Gammaproteobacteria bacterium]
MPDRLLLRARSMATARRLILFCGIAAAAMAAAGPALAHGIAGDDQAFLLRATGMHIGPYIYLGAKHMVTGYDHLLFLAGVIFFLYRLRDVAVYVTLFAVGHSVTLLAGVLGGLHVNSYIVDAIIGLSVVYKAFENLGGFRRLGVQPNTKAAVLIFGFFHGFGLATKLQDLAISEEGLVANMISFNIGVEIGQLLALSLILIAFTAWRTTGSFLRHAYAANVVLMAAGFVLIGYQLTGYAVT